MQSSQRTVRPMANVISLRYVHVWRIALLVVLILGFVYYIMPSLSVPGKTMAAHKDIPRYSDLYEFYAPPGGIKKGLEADGKYFTLNGKNIFILSGAIHYFRVPRVYWKDRLLKLKACGFNTVETYVPWNLHEPLPGEYNFVDELDIRHFLSLAQKIGLFVILRPGPYICAEWEFGGLPYWLLRDPNMKVRTSYKPYIDAVDKYFEQLLTVVRDFQFTRGGPVIAVQIENEYGSYGIDKAYPVLVKQALERYGIVELLFTSDGPDYLKNGGSIPGVLATANFQNRVDSKLKTLQEFQPSRPLMVMEFWSGWFDHWGEKHHLLSLDEYKRKLRTILDHGASFNLYMFHGGTNFGFMNGANGQEQLPHYLPTITSYDYDALLTESGDLTPKYSHTRQLVQDLAPGVPKVLPSPPPPTEKKNYGRVEVVSYLTLERMLDLIKMEKHYEIIPMELLDCNDGAGQGYGYIFYRNSFQSTGGKVMIEGRVRDRAHISLFRNNQRIMHRKIVWTDENYEVLLPTDKNKKPYAVTLEILVENLGRVNFQYGFAAPEFVHLDNQRKGIVGSVWHNTDKLVNWEIYPLEFNKQFMTDLSKLGWFSLDESAKEGNALEGPSVFKGVLNIKEQPSDTYVRVEGWGKGIIFINNFNLGRYWDNVGPQKTLYVPASCLREGDNLVIIFELDYAQPQIQFIHQSILQT